MPHVREAQPDMPRLQEPRRPDVPRRELARHMEGQQAQGAVPQAQFCLADRQHGEEEQEAGAAQNPAGDEGLDVPRRHECEYWLARDTVTFTV